MWIGRYVAHLVAEPAVTRLKASLRSRFRPNSLGGNLLCDSSWKMVQWPEVVPEVVPEEVFLVPNIFHLGG